MAFFKFRKKGDDQSPASVQPESVEVIRRRAKYRLLGSAVLVLAGVIGFPMLFDRQPRPVAVDMPIDIPDKNKVKPLVAPTPTPAPAPTATTPPAAPQVAKVNPVPAAAVAPTPVARVVAPPVAKITPPAKVEPKIIEPKVVKNQVAAAPVAPKTVAKPEVIKPPQPKPEPKPEPKPAPAPVVKPTPTPKNSDGNKALALLEGRSAVPDSKPAASENRFVVQVGAFSDTTRAREVRLKMEQAGIKTYTQTVETKDGPRIRVRAGPFSNKVEADRAAEKIKRLSLPASTLTL